MKGTLLLLGLTIVAINGASVNGHTTSEPTKCTSHKDCQPGYCCTIAFEKYSYPRCQKYLKEGDQCRPGGPLVTNGSRYYPDGTEIKLDNVYMMFCPCSMGLDCDKVEGICHENSKHNQITN